VPIPPFVAQWNKKFIGKVLVHLAGLGPFVELEHVGRRSGTVYRIPLMAFRAGDEITIALTYGREVDWLKNLRAAGGCRMRLGNHLLMLGPPRDLRATEGRPRMPFGARQLLPLIGVDHFVELDVLAEAPFTTW